MNAFNRYEIETADREDATEARLETVFICICIGIAIGVLIGLVLV